MYAIVDIETTGGRPQSDKITEIAIYIHDGERIVDEYATLINPEKPIPYFITGLTGISNEMVEDAPRFFEVAKQIVEVTQDHIFVAHNANFDYNFIKEEFKRLGYTYKRDVLDTVKLSRRLIPGLRSYSLGKLCKEVDIKINNRHRAAGDALATTKLFELLLGLDHGLNNKLFTNPALSDLHPNLDGNQVKNLPEDAGVYYFYDDNKELLYVGKSKNIRQRVLSHFANRSTRKKIEMRDRIAEVSYEITGSELVAFLLESDEIKKNKPVYNRAQRRETTYIGVFSYSNNDGYLCFRTGKDKDKLPLASFSSMEKAKDFLTHLTTDYNLCQKLSGLYESSGACFQYQIGICHGACICKESSESYNIRAQKAKQIFEYEYQNFLIIDKGRDLNEKSVVKIENGKYIGFGYFDADEASYNNEILHDCIRFYRDNRDIQSIVKRYLRNNKVEKILTF